LPALLPEVIHGEPEEAPHRLGIEPRRRVQVVPRTGGGQLGLGYGEVEREMHRPATTLQAAGVAGAPRGEPVAAQAEKGAEPGGPDRSRQRNRRPARR
jgi:hypothetical protein